MVGGKKPLFAGKHFQNEVTRSPIKISRQLLKGGLLFAYVFFGYITRIPVIPRLILQRRFQVSLLLL